MATFLRILGGQTTDLIETNHSLEFTRSFSPSYFHPPVFPNLLFKKWLKIQRVFCLMTLTEFGSQMWWQRPQTRVKCRHCRCGFKENTIFKSNKCDGCEKQMQFMDGIVFTIANPWYAGKLDDPQGSDTTMLTRMEQVREVMTVNQEMEEDSSWIWLTLEQMGFPLRSRFANENHGEAWSSKQCKLCNDQGTDQNAFFLAPTVCTITNFILDTKRELYDEKLEDALEILDLEWSKDEDTTVTGANKRNLGRAKVN